jgi:hypothetical protein
MHPFFVLVSIVLTLASHVTGFRSSALPLIQRKFCNVQHNNKFCIHTTKIICHQQTLGTNELNEEEPEVVIQIEDLSSSQIAELIEVSFIQACMVLPFVCRFAPLAKSLIHYDILCIIPTLHLSFKNIAAFTGIRRCTEIIYRLSKVSLPTMPKLQQYERYDFDGR